eukprot:Skav230340  [mRNA]  locus=scaffold920:346919:350316:- [translate_table: standard]
MIFCQRAWWFAWEPSCEPEGKGNFMYGAKCSAKQLKDLPRMIVILNVVPIIGLALWPMAGAGHLASHLLCGEYGIQRGTSEIKLQGSL